MAKLALAGGSPLRAEPFHGWPVSGNGELENLRQVLDSGKWGGMGHFESEFCKEFAQFQGGENALLTTSGMMALFVALKAFNVGPGDQVIVPAFPRPTELAVCFTGATPVFVDISKDNLCLDPELLEAAITSKTKAVIAIHSHNTMADIDKIRDICTRNNIPWIEDCAHAHGFKWNNVGAGYHAPIGIFSMERSKPLTAGEGGIITTNDRKLHDTCRSIIDLGKGCERADLVPWNMRTTEFQAAVALAQLRQLPGQIAGKLENIAYFEKCIDEFDGIGRINQDSRISNATGFLFSCFYQAEHFNNVDLKIFASALQEEGMPVRMRTLSYTYPAIKTYLAESGSKPKCPIAEKLVENHVFTIPHWVFLGDKSDIDDLMGIIRKVKENIHELKNFKIKNLFSRLKNKALGFIR